MKKPDSMVHVLLAAHVALALVAIGCGSKADGPGGAGGGATAASSSGATSSSGGASSSSSTSSGGGAGGAACKAPAKDTGDCNAPLAPGADRKCTLMIGGQPREVLLYAPKSWDPCKPVALVVDAHGTSETDAEQAGLVPFLDWPNGLGSGFRLVADQEGFLVVEPQGLQNAWDTTDADFMLAIPAWVKKVADVDPKRTYMSGISNGGALTYWTACKDTDTFRAFAPVSGYGVTSCKVTHPAPLIAFHTPDDKIVPMSDDQASFQAWVATNHCKQGPAPSLRFGGPQSDPGAVCLKEAPKWHWSLDACDAAAPATTCQTWSGCDGGFEATFCQVPADMVNHYDQTGGHVLYINGTGLSLAAVAWQVWKKAAGG